ncbi:MAG: PD-(D/E)XK nuclease family protein [Candidatus Nanoarchaeia archaeon]|nr:PD-(D/E)XK nuclease family protein [Candidatus Nanoarchaeia archaeon]
MIYSHSSISTFNQCPLKFKMRYIDKITPELKKTIEAFMGGIVHEVLQELYESVMEKRIPGFDEVQESLINKWKNSWDDEIQIIKEGMKKENYFESALRFLKNYYEKCHPFNEGEIIGIEQEVRIIIKGKELIGYIDRLEKKGDEYHIIDYKTNNWLKSQEELDEDKQLAIYQIAVMEKFCTDKVVLNWHFLNFNELMQSKRTKEQINELKDELFKKINEIESEKEFKACKSRLCDWCEYKKQCPAFITTLNDFN